MNKDQPISRTGLEISITQTKIYKNRKKKTKRNRLRYYIEIH